MVNHTDLFVNIYFSEYSLISRIFLCQLVGVLTLIDDYYREEDCYLNNIEHIVDCAIDGSKCWSNCAAKLLPFCFNIPSLISIIWCCAHRQGKV